MIKAVERMKVRCRLEQVGCMCHGQWLISARRLVEDSETGLRFQMIMRWASGWEKIKFDTFNVDAEDFPWEPDKFHVEVSDEIISSSKFEEIKAQLLRAVTKKIIEQNYHVYDDLSVK